ncbi:BsuPI-related putative proteinase inhibitor [Halobaculum limi]|uniref:BsuPI-related putative proteinase inhibitor n=1 Tax=Halobaculum limi TaxID=3031916 RepID=UPI002406E7F4|nr:BsuPI-related putative proteinase inhibitor [Halobaculum sp. YSMS11]
MSSSLDATLTVAPTDDGLSLSLTVENAGTDAVDLSFSDGQRAEFVARDAAHGEVVWRWSDGRMFTMALGSETLAAGESATYEGTWESPPAGEYEVTASLATGDTDAAATMMVVVPADE